MNAKKFEISVIIIFIFHRNSLFESVFLFFTAQKMKFSIKDFFNKCDQIRFATKSINTIHQDSYLLSYLGPKLWEMVEENLKI